MGTSQHLASPHLSVLLPRKCIHYPIPFVASTSLLRIHFLAAGAQAHPLTIFLLASADLRRFSSHRVGVDLAAAWRVICERSRLYVFYFPCALYMHNDCPYDYHPAHYKASPLRSPVPLPLFAAPRRINRMNLRHLAK